jgi:hypothetical protein
VSKKLAKYIVTTGSFDGETNNIKDARKRLAEHSKRMKVIYGDNDTYGIYMLVEKSK